MEVTEYESPASWLKDISPLLLQAEAENNLLLGLAGRAVAEPEHAPEGMRLWSVTDRGMPAGAAVLTPRHNLVLSRQSARSLTALVDSLAASSAKMPGVVGPDEISEQFAALWTARTGTASRQRMLQRIYACTEVVWPQRSAGDFRAATEDDTELLADWWVAFGHEVDSVPSGDDPTATVHRIIASGRLFVWTIGNEIVSCAGVTRPTASGIAVYFVFTPRSQRGRGFATSCVAELTHKMLVAGRSFCCLYTDLANPIANAIYARLGYQRVCDSQWWEFSEKCVKPTSTPKNAGDA